MASAQQCRTRPPPRGTSDKAIQRPSGDILGRGTFIFRIFSAVLVSKFVLPPPVIPEVKPLYLASVAMGLDSGEGGGGCYKNN
jgi:hypothetical protein